jgi:membrane protease subunit HflK
MAWNEPGGGNSGGKRNPWGGGNKPDQGPPDLDEVFRNLRRRFGGLFGGGGTGGRGPVMSGPARGFSIGTIAIVLLAIWAFTGLYQVDAAERALVLRFGKYIGTTQPGLRWHLPWPIETKQIINIQSISSFDEQTRMLTSDETLVDINLEVQYRRANAIDYAFNVQDPESTLKEVSESAIREIIGRSRLNDVLESGRQLIVAQTKELIQRTLDAYKVGLEVTSVNLQDVRVPTEVASAQQDAIKAREDRDRYSLAAQAYANDLIPRARGEGVRRIEDAHAYSAKVVADAEGETQRFLKLLTEYEQSPGVTRERLYLETLEAVLASSKKVVIDSQGSGNLLYLPIDKLMETAKRPARPANEADSSMTVEGSGSSTGATFESDRRARGSR